MKRSEVFLKRSLLSFLICIPLSVAGCMPSKQKPVGMAEVSYPQGVFFAAESHDEKRPKAERSIRAKLADDAVEGDGNISRPLIEIEEEYLLKEAFTGRIRIPFMSSFDDLIRDGEKSPLLPELIIGGEVLEPSVIPEASREDLPLYAGARFDNLNQMTRLTGTGPEGELQKRLGDPEHYARAFSPKLPADRTITLLCLKNLPFSADQDHLAVAELSFATEEPFVSYGFNAYSTEDDGGASCRLGKSLAHEEFKDAADDREAYVLFFEPSVPVDFEITGDTASNKTDAEIIWEELSFYEAAERMLKSYIAQIMYDNQGEEAFSRLSPLMLETLLSENRVEFFSGKSPLFEDYISQTLKSERIFYRTYDCSLEAGESIPLKKSAEAGFNYAGLKVPQDIRSFQMIAASPLSFDFEETVFYPDENLRKRMRSSAVYKNEGRTQDKARFTAYEEDGMPDEALRFGREENLSLVFEYE